VGSLRKFLESNNFTRVKLKKINTNHFEIVVNVNGVKGRFILDTGASNSCIAMESVSHFKLITTPSEIKAAGAGAVDMETLISEKNAIAIESWKKKNINFVVFDMSHVNEALHIAEEASVHGIIGADILKAARAVIDYGRNCVYLKK